MRVVPVPASINADCDAGKGPTSPGSLELNKKVKMDCSTMGTGGRWEV